MAVPVCPIAPKAVFDALFVCFLVGAFDSKRVNVNVFQKKIIFIVFSKDTRSLELSKENKIISEGDSESGEIVILVQDGGNAL